MAIASSSSRAPRWLRLLRVWRDAAIAPQVGPGPRWRTLGAMFGSAGAIALLTLGTGVDPLVSRPAIVVIAWLAIVAGVLFMLAADALPGRGFSAGLVLSVALVSAAVIVSKEADSPYALFYIWVGAQAWYCLEPRGSAALSALTLVASAGSMAIAGQPDGDTFAWWLLITSTLVVVAILGATLRMRSERLIATLSDAALHDPLTGLLNRRGYQQFIEREFTRAKRYGSQVSVVLGDLDNFKALNDRLGHREGDRALAAFADVCRAHTRDSDGASRVGGEEFVLVLPETSTAAAVLLAERLRRAVGREIQLSGGIRVTASFGVATYPRHGTEPESLLDHADQAMYAAKRLGRDRVLAFADDLPNKDEIAHGGDDHFQAVLMLAEAVDLRDPSTAAHSERVGVFCEQISVALGLPRSRVRDIRLAGRLHDVGKVAVPDHILRKPGSLNPAEVTEIRKHAEVGAHIVAGAGLKTISTWVLAHHERPDGSGYPYGLCGEEIPLEARIIGVADAYEAMISDRPYQAAVEPAEAMRELERGAGTQFDPDVVAAFQAAMQASPHRALTPV